MTLLPDYLLFSDGYFFPYALFPMKLFHHTPFLHKILTKNALHTAEYNMPIKSHTMRNDS